MFRKAFDRLNGIRHRVAVSNLDENGEPLPSRTQQHLKDETDINNIIKKYDRTGLLNHVNQAVAICVI